MFRILFQKINMFQRNAPINTKRINQDRDTPIIFRVIEVITLHFTHHTITAHALIALAELYLVANQWLHLLFKLSLAEALEEIATSISKQARLNDEHAFNISLYYIHLSIYINNSI